MSAHLLTISRLHHRFRAVAATAISVAIALILAGSAAAAGGFYIRGGGNGHGVGMSQYGTYGYALHGKNYRWILAHYYRGTAIGTVDPSLTVRLLLSTGPAAFTGASRADAKRLSPRTTYTARPNADGSVTLLGPSGKKVASFRSPLTVTGPGPLRLAGHGSYRGALELRPDRAGGIETVNVVGLEDYVRGVISAEMPAGWAPQALMTQAVAARTFAITSDVGGRAFDLYPDTRSQMYGGVGAETRSTDAAVKATRAEVVTYRGKPARTYFFSSSGGHTENVEDVWPGSTPEPWLRGVSDPYDGAGGDPYHHWRRDMTLAAAAAHLGTILKGSLIGIRVTKHGSSARILTAEVVGTKGHTSVTGTRLQRAFGLLTTYATFTTITADPGPPPARAPRGYGGARHSLPSLLSIVKQIVARTIPALHGSVYPAPRSGTVAVQLERRGVWRRVARAHVGRTGTFSVSLPATGTYRVVYRGVNGPAVTLH